ncbi:hypothetical protein KP509_33G002100 [Ceratopteris richardii]|uniref:LsmAD domain-containing protein n=1 Tax=Ceratopteris richardii TaxID=49495 RepID=A0A8T2QL74_CERRI|nr:hypothetical protein KP509_33G002100 [Ceratopteris richardii]KAH7284907.1 hypothetical protein KP509_33G002100 [Ceratopteris richardii]KAH7284912.1 hypothetical protein KP509_33G002100 [Ceratopteris richardii]
MSQVHVESRPIMVNGANHRRGDQDLGGRPENSKNDYPNYRPFRPNSALGLTKGVVQQHNQVGSVNFSQPSNSKPFGDNTIEAIMGSESREHLIILTACLIGQLVEVQVKNGSIYSGIFHTASAEKDYGIVIKCARLVREASSKGKNSVAKGLTTRPYKTLLIQAKDLVQISAKDVPIGTEVAQNGRVRENHGDIITDSVLSHGKQGEMERELKPWTPDNDDLKDPGLDSTFQNTWNRNWDQFEINKTLFGVESTFDEELYTTKLDRGPQSREREREALRIAREIEAENSRNHLSQEKGEIDEFDTVDEESRFASVMRASDVVGVSEAVHFNKSDHEASGSSFQAPAGSANELRSESYNVAGGRDLSKPDVRKPNEDALSLSVGSKFSNGDNAPVLQKKKMPHVSGIETNKHIMKVAGITAPSISMRKGDATSIQALNLDPGCPQVTEDVYRDFNEFRQQENAKCGKKHREDQTNELRSFSENLKAGGNSKALDMHAGSAFPLPISTLNSSVTTGLDSGSLVVATRSLSSASDDLSTKASSSELDSVSDFSQAEIHAKISSTQHLSETENTLENSVPSKAPSSPSAPVFIGSESFRRSNLNPNAKEFKLNPNAKSFTPTFTHVRPASPAIQAPVFVPAVISQVAQMPNMPVGVSVNPMVQPVGQSAAKYTSYNPVGVSPASGSSPYFVSPGTYTPGAGVSGAAVPPVLGGGQSTVKVASQLQQPSITTQTYGAQQPIRYASQSPALQATSTYIHPNGHLYSQQMMFGQPGQVVYIQPYPQAAAIPPPQSAQAPSQPKHRAPSTGVQGVQLCVTPPFISGQQHFLPQMQVSQISNPMQPAPAVLLPTTVPAIQPPQGVIGGLVAPAQPNTGTRVMRVGEKYVGMNMQQ